MNCKICFGEHEEEIHAATLRVREWLRDEVLKGFEVEDETGPEEEPDATAELTVAAVA